MRDHRRVGVGAAYGKGAHRRDVSHFERRDRLTEQCVGAEVLQRNAILRVPTDMIGQRFDQMVCRENPALMVENQRRQADQRQRFAGDCARSNWSLADMSALRARCGRNTSSC